MQPINLSNFSKLRLTELRLSLDEIHQAGVYHGDPKPRNMMICCCSGEQLEERVLWIDFDSAQTFSESGGGLSFEASELGCGRGRDDGLFCGKFGRFFSSICLINDVNLGLT